ncbi:BTAD domain-containing putative transcriptional regulator [Arthrobacter sp. PsM3]
MALVIVTERAQGNDLCALRSYKNYETHLRENLGVKPSLSIRRIVFDLL